VSFSPYRPKIGALDERPKDDPHFWERSAERPAPLEGGARPARLPGTSGAPLHFYRCGDCFGNYATEAQENGLRCDCTGALEYLGRAKHERLIVDGLAIPCDARCISARGPKCECGCGGANHGNGTLVPVERDAGGIPHVSKPADRQKRHAIADTFRAQLKRARNTYRARVGEVSGYDAPAWQIREQLQNARKFKTQKRRLAAIDAAERLLLEYRKNGAGESR
jgi:hypothetical protein